MSPPLARLTFAMGAPLRKWTTVSTSMLVYGSPQRSTGSSSTTVVTFQFKVQSSVNPDSCRRGQRTIWPHAAHAIPRVLLVRRLTLTLITLEEPRHKELLGERRQLDASGVAVLHNAPWIVEVDDLHDSSRLRRVIC